MGKAVGRKIKESGKTRNKRPASDCPSEATKLSRAGSNNHFGFPWGD
jgi:hypothetical protein